MSEMKKYMSVVRLGHKTTENVLQPGDPIIIQEKLAGANGSFKLEEGEIVAFSRNERLTEQNNLQGFYEWTQTLDANQLRSDVVYFGEWLTKHKINYGDLTKQFFLFDLYDIEKEKYIHFTEVKKEAERLKLNLIPVFYEGEYQSLEHLESFIGQTALGVKKGEGIVVKNVDYQDVYGKQLFVKLVIDAFKEVQRIKKPKDPNFQSAEIEAVQSVLTRARVEKWVYKLVDEGVLQANFGMQDMAMILKRITPRIVDDIVQEEGEQIASFDLKEIRKVIGKQLPLLVKEVIEKK
ncbi:RNA ligase family protein [Paenibacillus nicotianae]|uniref:RNA ligase family protein n=1 Tax=Paenibacillus nicotianae TaxID=1526551 RepID=A0ABW4URC8_9BACL